MAKRYRFCTRETVITGTDIDQLSAAGLQLRGVDVPMPDSVIWLTVTCSNDSPDHVVAEHIWAAFPHGDCLRELKP